MAEDRRLKAPRRNDVLLIVLLLAAAGGIWLWSALSRTAGTAVRVTVGGNIYGTYPLDRDDTIRVANGENYNILVIKDGEASISEASCPNKLCIKQGKISAEGQSIICLPNKLVVEVIGGKSSGTDTVAR